MWKECQRKEKSQEFLKSQRLKWLGHVERMPEEREVTRIYKIPKTKMVGPCGKNAKGKRSHKNL